MKARLVQLLVAGTGVAAALVLAACSSGSPEPATPTEPAETAAPDTATSTPTPSSASDVGSPGGATARCVVGDWALDTENAGTQLWAFLQSAQITQAGDVDMSGDSRLSITADGQFVLTPNLTVAATLDMHGAQAVLWQQHTGNFQASWVLDDPATMRFESVTVNEYAIDQALTMNGADVPMPFEMPPPVGADIPLNIGCEGDTLIYSPPEAPITSVWRRVG